MFMYFRDGTLERVLLNFTVPHRDRTPYPIQKRNFNAACMSLGF